MLEPPSGCEEVRTRRVSATLIHLLSLPYEVHPKDRPGHRHPRELPPGAQGGGPVTVVKSCGTALAVPRASAL